MAFGVQKDCGCDCGRSVREERDGIGDCENLVSKLKGALGGRQIVLRACWDDFSKMTFNSHREDNDL